MQAILDLGCLSFRPSVIILSPLNILRKVPYRILTKLCIYIYIDMIYLWIVTHNFSNNCTGFMALGLRRNFVSTRYYELLDICSPNFILAFIFNLTRSSLGLLVLFSKICTRVMALYLRQNFVSARYIENQLVEFHQILYMHSY